MKEIFILICALITIRREKPCFFEKAGHVFCREIENHEWWARR